MDSQNPFLVPESHGAEHEDSQEVLAERAIADAGQSQAMYNYNQKLLEQKERELMESIALNYGRIREVERELGNLQLQLKLTSGPKKHALELLRKKIEAQNERVAYVRSRHTAAKATYERLDAELKQEEAAKDQLCSELNTLVQQAAKAQLDKLEELKATLEGLYSGIMPPQAAAQRNRQQQVQAAAAVQQQQQQQQELGATSGQQPQPGEACPSGAATTTPTTTTTGQTAASAAGAATASGAPAADEGQQEQLRLRQEQERQEQERQEQERRAAEERRRWEAEAAMARSRHVSLGSTAPGVAGGLTTTTAAAAAAAGTRPSGAPPAATSAAPAGTAGPQRGAGAAPGASSKHSGPGAGPGGAAGGPGGGAGARAKVQNGGSAAPTTSKQRFSGFDT